MPDVDPGDLSRLHDIVEAAPVPWWPPALGWYVVGAAVVASLGFVGYAAFVQRRRNRYRREALRELRAVAAQRPSSSSLGVLAALLKRAALAAYPRERVAALTGDAWLGFLDATDRAGAFTQGAGRLLGDAAYEPGPSIDAPAWSELIDRAENWIRRHRC